MKDNLEQLVSENRQAFDDKEPTANVWKGIYRKLNSRNNYDWLWKAAAILFFLTSIGLATDMQINKDEKIAIVDTEAESDFAAVENFYFSMISEKKSLIYDFEERNVSVDQDFEQDLQKLDAMYQVLKEEVVSNPSKKVVDALILNLLVRIDILNKQLQELDQGDTRVEAEEEGQVNV